MSHRRQSSDTEKSPKDTEHYRMSLEGSLTNWYGSFADTDYTKATIVLIRNSFRTIRIIPVARKAA